MPKEIIRSSNAPAAVGPYSQAVRAGAWVFVSGQIPLDPQTGAMATGTVQDQTRRVLENLRSVLEAAHLALEDVVKVTVYLKDINDFAAMNEVYASFFASEPPARACIQAARLPKDAAVEMDAVAWAGEELPPAVGGFLV